MTAEIIWGTVFGKPNEDEKPTDAYEQLESEQPGELLYMSKPLVEPPCDVER